MSNQLDLHQLYEGELFFIRKLAQEFAQRYPATAGRLRIEANRSADPHVERLIEAFALLTARVQLKLHDEFPELTDALLGVLYPHYLAPVPSMAVAQFDSDPLQPPPPTGHLIAAGSPLLTQAVGGVRCQYRTGYPVTLWPVTLAEARLEPPPFPAGLTAPSRAVAALRLVFEAHADCPFEMLRMDKLRLYLHGDGGQAYPLYELLLNHALQVVFRPAGARAPLVTLSPERCLAPVGFGTEEGLLPYPPQSFVGYRLLTEFFAFPQKFLFVDVSGWRLLRKPEFGRKVEVVIFLNRTMPRLEQTLDAGSFRLGCTPVVNLFELTAEPIDLKQTRPEYRVLPDATKRQGLEVYSIDAVTGALPDGRDREFQPFYSFRHGERDAGSAFWYAARKPSQVENDRGSEVFVSLVDRDFSPARPAETVMVLKTTCINRDLPSKLPRDGSEIRFDVTFAAPISRVRCLGSPTPTLRPPTRRGAHWRLVSHLLLNHLSLANETEGLESLKEILRLYDFSDPEVEPQLAAVTRQQIDGLVGLRSKPAVGCIGRPGRGGFCHGLEVTVEFDDQKYAGTSAFLFASVLERFLGLYVTVNSFAQLVARTRQGTGEMRRWPPRAGEQPLL